MKKQEELIEFVPPSDTPKPDPNSLVLDATEEPKPTLRVVPKPYLEFGYDDGAFDWADDGSIVIPHAPGVAVYQNANGGIVIRQHGAGPIFLLPTATDELLGAGKWGAGPTGVVVWQGNGWTVGILAWHNWSFAGEADRADVDETFLQPVLAYTTSRAWTFTLQGEDTYNWETSGWLAPINFLVSKIVKVEGQPISIVGGVRYWMDSPDTGPHGFGGRLGMTFLFPAR